MASYSSFQQDMSSTLVASHEISSSNDAKAAQINIDRLELHLGHPSGVRLGLGRVHALTTIRRRRPIYFLPPNPTLILNRSAELETLRQSLIARGVVDLHGRDGAGKSTLAATLVHKLDLNHFPDGSAFFTGPIRFPDLLQALFDSFYESDIPVKITLANAQTYLQNLRALVVLDDLGLSPKQIDPVLDALHEAAILIVCPERTALGRGRALPLSGLSRQDAVLLFEKGLGRTVLPDEADTIHRICSLLNNMPLPISCVAAMACESKQNFSSLLADLQDRKPWSGPGGDPSVGPSLEQIVLILDSIDRQLLTLVAAFAAPSVSKAALRSLAGLSVANFQPRVEQLVKLGLLRSVPPVQGVFIPKSLTKSTSRLALSSAYYKTVRTWLVHDAERRKVVEYYTTWLSRGEHLPGEELRGLLGAIEDCAHYGWLDHLKPLVQAADRSLARLGWWAEWQHILDLTRRVAQEGGDRALEAWAMHQLGTLLGSLSVFDRALHLLGSAESIRKALGDEAGAELSAHNRIVLEQLLPATAVDQSHQPAAPAAPRLVQEEPRPALESDEPARPSSEEGGRAGRWKLRAALLAASVVLALGTLALKYVWGVGEENDRAPKMTVSWEFGDAWNAYDNKTWTQQIKIIIEGGDGDYSYYVNDQPVEEMFEVVLPLCDDARGTIRVESSTGQSATTDYAFDSPFCR